MKEWIFTAINACLFGVAVTVAIYEPSNRFLMCVVAANTAAWAAANIKQGLEK